LSSAFAEVHRLSKQIARSGDVLVDELVERLEECETFSHPFDLVY
jgi:hypothetical protein